jgi:sterol 14-demethylase
MVAVAPLKLKTPPMLDGLPVLGNALEFASHRSELLQRGYEQYGSVFGFRLANKPVAVLIGPEFQEQFFVQTDKTLNMDKAYQFLAAMFGRVAFTASKEDYYEQRPLLHLPFGRTKMLTYIQVMQEEIQMWLDSLGEEGEIELVSELIPLIQNIAAHALMGREFRHRMGREFWNLYTDLAKGLDPLLPPNLPLPKFRKRDQARKRMLEILQPVLDERRRNPDQYDDFMQDFINGKLKDGSAATDELVSNLILGLMFAGHETTLGQAAWTIIQMLQHPVYLRMMQEELDRVLPFGEKVSPQNMSQLQHLDYAVQETARMYPSADMLMRFVQEDTPVGDYVVPAGWLMMVSAGTAHFLPELFPNPYSYDPLRYAPERAEDRQHRFALIPYGGGVHKCAGMNFANNEMMLIAALLFQQFEVELRTAQISIVSGGGANRPSPTKIYYKRRKNLPEQSAATTTGAAVCPVPH